MTTNNLSSSFIGQLAFGLAFSAAHLSGDAHALTLDEFADAFRESDVVQEVCLKIEKEQAVWRREKQNIEIENALEEGEGVVIGCLEIIGLSIESADAQRLADYCDSGFRADLELALGEVSEDDPDYAELRDTLRRFRSGFVLMSRERIVTEFHPNSENVLPDNIEDSGHNYGRNYLGCFFWNQLEARSE